MTPVELSRSVLHAVRRAVDAGELRVEAPALPSRVSVTPPGPGGCGDYATNVALQLARPAGQPPLRVAEVLRPYLSRAHGVAGVEITGPGFLNISLDRGAGAELVRGVLRDGPRHGHSDRLAGQVIEIRVPHDVRAEVLADALARMIESQGGRVEIDHREPVNLRPVPAPEDPAPLGPDASQWALLHPAPHDRPRITADHLVQHESNPLFRVRYAHARTRAISRNAADLGFSAHYGPEAAAADQAAAADDGPMAPAAIGPDATPLLTLLADHPRLLASAVTHPRPADATGTESETRTGTGTGTGTSLAAPVPDPAAPSRLTRHLLALADGTLAFLPTVLPRGAEKPSAAHRARLALAEAAGTVLAGGLSLLGIDAPDHL